MEKTKLSLPVTLVAAATWLLGLYAGYLLTAIVVGYVLLMEENLWLKKNCLKVLAMMLIFSVASTILGLPGNLFSIIYSFLDIFNIHIHMEFLLNSFNFLGNILSVCKTLVFILLAIYAAANKTVKIPVLDDFIDKIFA